MFKFFKKLLFLALLAAMVWVGTVIADRQQLSAQVVRLHVVADSDSAEDQTRKLAVRDAVLERVNALLNGETDAQQAKQTLQANLAELEAAANEVLEGSGDTAVVSFQQETFPTRQYDTFSLPAGVYDALRVTIGSGQGHNWWCVVFPDLCLPDTAEGFSDVAEAGGFPDSLTQSLTGEEGYEIRFFFLDWLGKVQNFFHRG